MTSHGTVPASHRHPVMSLTGLLILCLIPEVFGVGFVNSYPPTLAPKFLTRGRSYRAVIGQTLVLPCEVQNLGTFVLLWRRGASVLTASTLMVTRDPRFRLVDGYNLQIGDVRPQDAGDYMCQISDQDNRDQVHTVEILVPASVRAIPSNGHITSRKGGTVTLECKASGNPVPHIHWTKKEHGLPSQLSLEGPTLTLERLERKDGGVYRCISSNGVGEEVTADIQLTVLSPPEITVERSWVHAGEGHEAQLSCSVHGETNPDITWYQDSFPIQQSDRKLMDSRGEKHSLTIRNVQTGDFGNYSCIADNSLGRAKKYIELSGRPGPAVFLSPVYGRSRESYNLTWAVQSWPPLEEVRLMYRKLMMNESYQQPGRWRDIRLQSSTPDSLSGEHVMNHVIRNLSPGAVYEAVVQAKNRHGWNEVSDIYQFYTRGSEPIMEDMLLIASTSGATTILLCYFFTVLSATAAMLAF